MKNVILQHKYLLKSVVFEVEKLCKSANKREQSEVYFDSAEREQTLQNGKFLDFQQITRSITVDHILRTKDEILPLAKQLMQSVEFHSHH